MTLRGHLQTLESRLQKISLRERRLLYAAALITPCLLFLQFAVTPVEQEQERLQDQIQQQRVETQALQDRIRGFATAADPLSSLERRLTAARERVALHEEELRLAYRELLSPHETATLLRQLLAHRDGLELQRLVRHTPEVLASGPDSPARLESHRIELEWTGPFLDSLAYLRHLEGIPVTWLWGTLDLVVEEHPVARVQLTLDALDLGGLEMDE